MLKPETAQKQLEQWLISTEEREDDDAKRFLPVVKKLPKKLRDIGYTLLDRDAKGEDDSDDWEALHKFHRQQATALEKLTASDLTRVFRTFFGSRAKDIDAAWQWLKSATYGSSYEPVPLRAPKNPELTLERRVEFVKRMISLAATFKDDLPSPAWLAAWVPYIKVGGWRTYEDEIAPLLAATIDAKSKEGEQVFQVLCQSARKEHDVGAMGVHVTQSLLMASRPEGWELMEKMLLAARRQEGLRQSILESVPAANAGALGRLLRLIVDENLARFSSVVQAMDSWFGLQWAAGSTKKVNDTIAIAAEFLEKPAERKKALAGTDAECVYLALWAIACEDVTRSVQPAVALLKHKSVEMRYVAALHLSRINHPKAGKARVQALDDEDLRVALAALEDDDLVNSNAGKELFESLERLLERMPAKPTTLKPLVWPWTEQTARRSYVSGQLLQAIGDLSPMRLAPHMKAMDVYDREQVAIHLAEQKKWDAQTRSTILGLVGDASADVREEAIKALLKVKLKPADTEQLEGYLTRTATDLRKGVVSLILTLTDEQAIVSAERLLNAKNKNQRLAGLEILRQLAEADRQRPACVSTAERWQGGRKKVLKDEQTQLDAIFSSHQEQVTLDNALGLMNPEERTKSVAPQKKNLRCVTAATAPILKSLDALVHKHRQEKITVKNWDGKMREELLGECGYSFPSPNFKKLAADQRESLPLCDVWEQWYSSRKASLKDKDGFDLLRAYVYSSLADEWSYSTLKDWLKGSAKRKPIGELAKGSATFPKLKYEMIVCDLLRWLLVLHPPKGGVDFCMDVLDTVGAMIPQPDMQALKEEGDDDDERDWRNIESLENWTTELGFLLQMPACKVSKKQLTRQWQFLCWLDEPIPGATRSRPEFSRTVDAYLAKDATIADITDHLLGPRESSSWGAYEALRSVTARRPGKWLQPFLGLPQIRTLVDRCVDRVLEIELARGEAATPATDAALAISAYNGVGTLMRLLKTLGKDGFKKITGWRSNTGDSRAATITEMIESTYPAEADTVKAFSAAMKQAIKNGDFPEERLLQLAFLAPQWTDLVEGTMKWDGLAEGLYWYMAHMGHGWDVDLGDEDDYDADEDADDADSEDDDDKPQKLSRWERLIRERTPLTSEERSDGAIDVAWFHRTYDKLTPKRWATMAEAAKFASSGTSRKRAQLITDVLLGRTPKRELVDGIRKRNLKENVRLLGLLPLAKTRDKDIVDRYEELQNYRRYANKLSSMSKPEALKACDIGMQNLAATAGYADPMRLQWAMEAESTKDLARGPVVVKKADVSLTLSLDEQAQPELTVRRGEKVLKSLPKTVNKDKKFVELRERNTQLKRQASRVKQSLESAMCRGDAFTGAELMQLADHAILWPQLERLVLVGEGIVGYPAKRGQVLVDHAGKLEPVKKNEQLRVAHSFDLFRTKAWNKWQQECFAAERLQPFKQVFRELYVLTKQEKTDKTFSNRYAGHQVNPKQAYALWGSRGWSVDEYENVFKAYTDEALIVSVSFNFGITTPLEVEGLTIEKVVFSRRDDLKPMPLTKVPPRVFSETMRDMDLVVSVAHAGEVDPEASASTVEMRTNLLRETCRLLNLRNVKLKASRAIIKGTLGEYSVHLGSGVVHRMPGGSVCIVPVHSQHRGRLFLPFADDDPKTAEVISKTLLLARDDEIDDPIILEQLR